jgi:hypothetical protein
MTRFRLGTRETFRSFEIRNFRLFFTGQLISQVGNWLTLIAQTLLVLQLTGNGFDVGILTACQFAPVLIIGAWAGLVADRSDKRRLLLIVQTIAMMQSFALAALAFTGNPPVIAIYAVALVGGFTVAFDNPAGVRGRDGSGGPRPQRGQPEQRGDDERARRRARTRRPAHPHRRLRLVLHAGRPVVPRGAGGVVDDPDVGATAGSGRRAGQGPGA